MLRSECYPPIEKVKPLELLRQQYNIPHDLFSLRILSSPSTTKQLQKNLLSDLKIKMPNASEKELWEAVLLSRINTYINFEFESSDIMEKANDVLKKAKSFDEICDFIVELDEKNATVDIDPVGKLIDDVLKI